MPVILTHDQFDPWLAGKMGPEELKPAAEDMLRQWEVSSQINRTGQGDENPTMVLSRPGKLAAPAVGLAAAHDLRSPLPLRSRPARSGPDSAQRLSRPDPLLRCKLRDTPPDVFGEGSRQAGHGALHLPAPAPVDEIRPVGPIGGARHALNGLTRLKWLAPFGMAFASRFVLRALGQVTHYLTDETIRVAAQRSVLDLITPETQVVIAHSLGSVVAYEAIQCLQQPLPLFMTLGSPLGLDAVVLPKLRPQPPTYPLQMQW